VSQVLTIAVFSLRESLRRRVFTVVGLLTIAFLALYGLGTRQAFQAAEDNFAFNTGGVDGTIVAGATLLGLACFGTLFLGAILAVFLTLGAVRGDAERGLLQPVLVREVSRSAYLLGRWLAAASVCAAYVALVFVAAAVITWIAGGWWPDRIVEPALGLAAGVAILAALSLAGSVVLGSAANGIAVFMLFGAGLVAGLLGQIGEALGSSTLDDVAEVTAWVLPFEALYQAGLSALTAETAGFTRFAIDLGPFGGAEPGGPLLWPWSLVYLLGIGAIARWAFGRRDL
jgi:ABC-type transport system involved in multi-copper enzyme maturation permease subunit